MNCLKHPDTPSAGTCSGCAEPFCTNCLVTVQGKQYCADCKSMAVSKDGAGAGAGSGAGADCKEALWSMILGIVSLICCGVILGPIALVLGIVAKNKISQNPGMGGSGKAIAGIILGIIGLLGGIVMIIIQVQSGAFENF